VGNSIGSDWGRHKEIRWIFARGFYGELLRVPKIVDDLSGLLVNTLFSLPERNPEIPASNRSNGIWMTAPLIKRGNSKNIGNGGNRHAMFKKP
jgi:hypothetical protein